MFISMPVLIGLGIAGAILVFLLLRRLKEGGHDNLLGAPRGMTPPRPAPRPAAGTLVGSTGLSPEVEVEVRALIASNQKIEAIKLVREATRLGLKEAKDLVEAM